MRKLFILFSLILLVLFVNFVSALNSVTTTYNFNSSYENINMWAYEYNAELTVPPSSGPIPGGGTDISSDSDLDTNNGVGELTSVSGIQSYQMSAHLFVALTSNINKADITLLKWYHNTGGTGNSNNDAYLWNDTSDTWILTTAGTGAGKWLYGTVTATQTNNFIDSNNKSYFIVETSGSNTYVDTDYIYLEITYSSVPTILLSLPSNNTNLSNSINYFSANFSDNYGLKNTTLYMWNSTGSNFTNSTLITNTINSTNLSLNLSDGTYTWNYIVFNNMGNSNWSSNNYTITIDSIAPSISITTPSNNTNSTNTNLNINFTRSDLHLNNCWWTNNSGINNYSLSSCENITNITWNQGTTNLIAYANDTFGNINSSQVSFTIDSIAPSLTITNPKIGNDSFSTGTIDLNYIVNDATIGLSSCWYKNDSGNNITIACGTNTTISQASDGTYTVYMWANDTLNNVASTSKIWIVSSNAPIINLNPISNDYWFNYGTNIYFNYTATDGNGLSECQLWGNWTGAWHKNYTWNSPNSGAMNFTSLNISDGYYKWNIWCNDTTGLAGTSSWAVENITFGIDTIYPNLNLISPTNSTYTTNSISLNFTSNDTNIDTCWYNINNTNNITLSSCNNTTFTANQGSSILRIFVNDSANNINSSNISFFVDSIIPSLNFSTTFTNASYLNYNTSIFFNISVSDTNLNTCWYSTNNSINLTFTCGNNLTLDLAEGLQTIKIYSNDTLNNINSTQISFTPDVTYPLIQSLTASQSGTTQNVLFSVNISGGIDSSTTENTTLTCTSGTTCSGSDTVSGFATFNLTVYSRDKSGNENNSKYSFTMNAATTPSGGGGLPPISTPQTLKYPTIGLVRPNITIVYSELEMSIIFAAINSQCERKVENSLSVVNYYEQCSLKMQDLKNISQELKSLNVDIESDELLLWYEYYKQNKIFQTFNTRNDIDKYKLVMASLPNPLIILPTTLDKYFIALPVLKYTFTANKPISFCEVTSANKDLKCIVDTNTTATIYYNLTNFDFLTKIVYSGQIAITSAGSPAEQDTRYVNIIAIRVINLNYKTWWTINLPIWIAVIIYIIVIFAILILAKRLWRKKKRWEK